MGYYKDLMQMHQARGYGDSDKYVCQFCFGDTFLKKTILEQGDEYSGVRVPSVRAQETVIPFLKKPPFR